MLHVLISLIVCPKPNVCCDGCCNPDTHCCVAGSECTARPTCNTCSEELNESTCTCDPIDNGCNLGIGEHPCGPLACCSSEEICNSECNCVAV